MKSSTREKGIICMNYEGTAMPVNFEPHKCVIFAKTMNIDTPENKAIHSMWNAVDGNNKMF